MASTITPLPDPPSRGDPANFAARGDAFLGALPTFTTQANLLAVEAEADAATATTQAGIATTQADIAATQADIATVAASSAVNAPGTNATSTTSNTIGTGSKTFTIQTGKAFTIGQFLVAANTAAVANYMIGQITAHDSGTGSITINSSITGGAGTFAAWTLSLSGSSAASIANFTPSRTIVAPNATIPLHALTPIGGEASIDFAVIPKGPSGSLLAALPDNASTGGNKRGASAVDLQLIRTANTQVASGNSSTISGGRSNTASAGDSVVSGGSSNIASSQGAVVSGGSGNVASGLGSAIPGGTLADTRGVAGSEAFGTQDVSFLSSLGTRQREIFVQVRRTTNNTPVVLTATGGVPVTANQITMPNNSTYVVTGQVTARQTATAGAGAIGDSAGWTFQGTFKRGAAAVNTSVVGTVTVTKQGAGDAGTAAWALTLTADTTLGCPRLTFTGEINKTIDLFATINSTEVAQ